MMNLGLKRAEYQQLKALLKQSHRLRVGIQVLTLDHVNLGSLTGSFLGGSVTIDTTTEVTRSASFDILDVSQSIQLAPDDPDDGAAYPTRMVRIIYAVGHPSLNIWYYIPVFTGPVTKADRDGVILHIEAQGKEVLSIGALWKGKTYKAGWNPTTLIKNAMKALAGESRFDLQRTTGKTSKKHVIKRGGAGPWKFVRNMASALGMQVFYDGRGVMRMRPYAPKPVWIFDETCLIDDPQIGYTIDALINAVEITGAKPKGAKKPLTYKVVAPKGHPLSPSSLARGGVPKYYPHIEENTDLKTAAAVKAYGDTILRNGLLQSIDATFESFVIPHIEENDMVALRTGKISTEVRVKQATIPLVCTDSMSVGYLKKVKPTRLSRRLRRK